MPKDVVTPSRSCLFIEEKTESREGTGFLHKHTLSYQEPRSQNTVPPPARYLPRDFPSLAQVSPSQYKIPVRFFPRHPQLCAESKLGIEELWHDDVELGDGPGGSRAQGSLPETDLASLAIFPGPTQHLKCED